MTSTVTDRRQGLSTSVAVKAPVRAVTTAAITLSGLQTVGGVSLVEGDRVLVKNQSDTTENGIYNASSGDWTRAKDFDGNLDFVRGTIVVANIDNGEGLLYRTICTDPVTVGTSSVTFSAITDPNRIYDQTEAEALVGVTPTNYAKFPAPLLDATRFGVVADGVTDNAVALANFVAVLKQVPGALGILPSGTILCSSLTVFNFASTVGITLMGGSALNGTKLVYTGTGSGNFIDARSSFGFSMNYISLYHNNAGFTGNLICFSHDGSGSDAQHGHLFRCAFGSIGTLYTAVGIQLDQATLITIDNCDFGALLRPIAGQATGGSSYSVGIRVENCQFAGYSDYAIYYGGQGWKINGNNFQPNKDGLVEVFAANANTPCDGFEFKGNTVLDASGASTAIVLYTASAVDISGNVAGCGGGGGVFLQANAAINGLSMRGNHISQCNYVVTVSNSAHHGWAINGNWGDTLGTSFIDHSEYVTGIDLFGNYPEITPATLSGNGYQQLPNGLIMQWGIASVTTGTPNAISFPTAFSSAVYSITATLQAPSGNGNTVYLSSPLTTGVTLNVAGTAGSNTVNWMAIGK